MRKKINLKRKLRVIKASNEELKKEAKASKKKASKLKEKIKEVKKSDHKSPNDENKKAEPLRESNDDIIKALRNRSISKEQDIKGPVAQPKENDGLIKTEVKNAELRILKSSLEFVATVLMEGKDEKSKDMLKACVEYIGVLEDIITELRSNSVHLKQENVKLQTSLDAFKVLKKYEKAENKKLREELDLQIKFKEYHKLQSEWILVHYCKGIDENLYIQTNIW